MKEVSKCCGAKIEYVKDWGIIMMNVKNVGEHLMMKTLSKLSQPPLSIINMKNFLIELLGFSILAIIVGCFVFGLMSGVVLLAPTLSQ